MSAPSANPVTLQLPGALPLELQELRRQVDRFKSEEISEAQFRAFRVPMGVYEQRESGTFMLRARLPAGGVLPHQLRRLAEVADTYGNGVLHVTTRQDIQVHRVPLDAIHPALTSLLEAGLSTKGGGGNTVRNITACCDSGVCADEVFDVAPYAVAVTERLLPDRLSFELPRKYKIAFSACSRDCAGATVNDLGFVARRKDGADGFAVYAGGGMGAKSRVADLLEEFVPAIDAFLVAEAVKRVFDKHGDRKNRHRARLRFLVERIGFAAFRQLYLAELAVLRASAPAPLGIRRSLRRVQASGAGFPTAPSSDSPAFDRWRQANVTPQKQPGFSLVDIPLALGDLPAAKMAALADVIAAHGEGIAYTTQTQNLVLRWVTEAELSALYARLDSLGLAEPLAPILRQLVACAGAATCRLGICLSRGLATAVTTALRQSNLDLEKVGALRLHIGGCPNACARHPVADIGLSGAARRVAERLVPYYTVHLGGCVAEGKTRLAANCGAIPARSVPAFLVDFLRRYLESGLAPDFPAFLNRGGRETAKELLACHRHVPAFAEDKNYYFDWEADTLFSLAGRGPGECSAGVFDLIEVDLASAHEALNAGRHYAAAALAARSLLVTRGAQPQNDAEAFAQFQKHFVAEGLVERSLETVIAAGARSATTPNPEQTFAPRPAEVAALVATVKSLYQNMDASLRFRPASVEKPGEAQLSPRAERVHDFRGIACPLNYVKTKMALGPIPKGQALTVLLDEPGAKNVPQSAAKDGHAIVSVTQRAGHWEVVIRKG